MIESVRPAHSSKPDPSEPWRYVCPDCGAHTVRLLSQEGRARREPGRKFQANGMGSWASRESSPPFYCKGCNTRQDRLEDKKTGRLVGPEAF